jgi:hypothetical protein
VSSQTAACKPSPIKDPGARQVRQTLEHRPADVRGIPVEAAWHAARAPPLRRRSTQPHMSRDDRGSSGPRVVLVRAAQRQEAWLRRDLESGEGPLAPAAP